MKKPGAVEALQEHAAAMRTTLSDLEAEAHKSTAKINEWTALQRRIQDRLARVPSSVTLDVGGTLFKTTKHTLLRVEGSFFHALLGSDAQDTAGGPHFLDLDPDCFRHVLKFLRTGKMALLNGLTKRERDEVNMMMETLKLAPPTVPPASFEWGDLGTAMKLSSDPKTVESFGPMKEWNAAVIQQPLVGSIELEVDSIGDAEEGHFCFGLCRATDNDVSDWDCFKNSISYWSDGEVYNASTVEASLLSIVEGDIVTIRRRRTHVEFQLPPRPTFNVDLDDVTEELFPFFSTKKGGVRVTIRN